MTQFNNQEKTNMLKGLSSKTRDTLSLKNKDNIRYNINKYINIYNRFINKPKINKTQQKKLDDTTNILNDLYDYLSNRSVSNDNLIYSPTVSFIINHDYAMNKIHSIKALFDNKHSIKALFDNKPNSLSNNEIKDIRKQIYENVKRYNT